MQAAEQELFITEEEYLAAEREGEERHEWYKGECFAMAGGTRWHNILSSRNIPGYTLSFHPIIKIFPLSLFSIFSLFPIR